VNCRGGASGQRGFTLLEVTLVLAVSGVLLMGAASLVFGLSQLRIAAEQAPQEDEHTANLVRFLEYAFSRAEPLQNPGEEGGDVPDDPVVWRDLPGSSDLNEQTLAFRLPGSIPLFVDDQLYLPAVDCYLRLVEGEGLFLYWQSNEMAEEDAEDLRRSLLSPLVTKLEYLWYDQEDDVWDVSDEAEENDEGQVVLPQFIRVTFRSEDPEDAKTALLLLPPEDTETPRL